MSVEQMRSLVIRAYPGPRWETKVRNMSDNQIVAMYYRLVQSGKIGW